MAIVCIPYKPVIRGNSHVINLYKFMKVDNTPHTPRIMDLFLIPKKQKKKVLLGGPS